MAGFNRNSLNKAPICQRNDLEIISIQIKSILLAGSMVKWQNGYIFFIDFNH